MLKLYKTFNLVFILLFLSILLLFFSCNRNVNVNEFYNLNRNKLEIREDSIMFEIDSVSLPYSTTIQYVNDSLVDYFTYFNQNTNSIYFFNYNTREQNFIWSPSDSLNYSFDSHFIVNMDSIFVFSTKNKILYLYNINGTVKDVFHLTHEMIDDSIVYPLPYLETRIPLVCFNNNIYLTGFQVGEFDPKLARKSLIKYSIQNEQLSFLVDFPSIYDDYNWGITYYNMTNSTYNPESHQLILNFPLSHNLLVYDLNTNKEKYVYAGSSYIRNIKPYSKNKEDFVDSNTRIEYYLENSSYVSVFYDTYKKIYYRISALPVEYNAYNSRQCWQTRQYQIIVLNSSFEYIGEVGLSGIIPENAFITKDGICIQVFSDDDVMKFKIINIET